MKAGIRETDLEFGALILCAGRTRISYLADAEKKVAFSLERNYNKKSYKFENPDFICVWRGGISVIEGAILQ